MGSNGMVRGGSAMDDDEATAGGAIIDEVTGLANRRGFMEILRLEERRHARYGGSPMLVLIDLSRVFAQRPAAEHNELLIQVAAILADAIRDTDTLARVDRHRFGILAIQAGCSAPSLLGRLRLHLEMHRIQHAEVTVGEPGALSTSWRALAGSTRPALRLVR